ncbi:hypothetical protein SEA_VANLEE_102 [Gordonia phage VanLee]|uniref:Uncharacterized protein n=1 Tax=Gordonia phage VanLee TaxID=2845816 RepID=A0A8F2IF89_9CAUD|nr:hypothetical protein QEH49_gp102 [Gordonia phage VanLee]QWS68219.1 hypothetical protein SEA_VANLEE_102 [Gordonia phage VanLee]
MSNDLRQAALHHAVEHARNTASATNLPVDAEEVTRIASTFLTFLTNPITTYCSAKDD